MNECKLVQEKDVEVECILCEGDDLWLHPKGELNRMEVFQDEQMRADV